MTYFKMISLIIYFIFLCMNSQKIYSVSTISGVSGMRIRAGYGYLGRSSEVEANSEIELEICDKSKKKKCEYYNKSAFGPFDHFGYAKEINNYSEKFFSEVNFSEKVREQLFEYLSLQLAAIDKTIDPKIPKCLKRGKKVKKIYDDISKFRKSTQSLVMINNISPWDEYYGNNNQLLMLNSSINYSNKDFENKIIAIEGSLLPNRIAEATLTYEYLNRAYKKNCKFSISSNSKLNCTNIKQKLDRIKYAFPILSTDNLLPSIATIIGLDNMTNNVDITKRGEQVIDAFLFSEYRVFDQLLGHSSAEYNKAIDNILLDTTNRRKKKTRTNFLKKIDNMKEKLKTKLQNDLKKICQTNFSSILKNHPTVIRQMYLDLKDKKERKDLKKYLCKNDFMKNFQNGPSNNCIGVSGNINGPNGLIIKKRLYGFPYFTDVFYRIKKGKNSGLIIELPKKYNFVYDPTIDPSHQDFDSTISVSKHGNKIQQKKRFLKNTKIWNITVAKFVNAFGNNHKPPVTLKIIDSKEAEAINVSTCYTGGQKPNGYISTSAKWSGDSLKSSTTPGRYRCGELNKYKIDDWQNVTNYTIDFRETGVSHENGHSLYLYDTYDSYRLPANLVGESDDVMASISGTKRLYPRDIKRIIFPALNCVD